MRSEQQKQKQLRVFPPRARKGFPQASALRLCSPCALSAALQGWEIPSLAVATPTFARRRSHLFSNASTRGKTKGGSTHEQRSRHRQQPRSVVHLSTKQQQRQTAKDVIAENVKALIASLKRARAMHSLLTLTQWQGSTTTVLETFWPLLVRSQRQPT